MNETPSKITELPAEDAYRIENMRIKPKEGKNKQFESIYQNQTKRRKNKQFESLKKSRIEIPSLSIKKSTLRKER